MRGGYWLFKFILEAIFLLWRVCCYYEYEYDND